MKNKLLISLAGLSLALLASYAQAVPPGPLVTFEISDPFITVGESFDVSVFLEYDAEAAMGLEAELTSFGFDYLLTAAGSSLTGVTVPDSFFDVFIELDLPFPGAGSVEGLAFPGIPDNKVLMATFSFQATAEGVDMLEIFGPVTNFTGAFYVDEQFGVYERPFTGGTEWTINPVPEPSQVALLGIGGLLGMLLVRRRFRR